MLLKERILELKQQTSGLTRNPVLDCFELDECDKVDSMSLSDSFIKSRKNSCLKHLKNVKVDFSQDYRNAFEEYNEAVIYIDLKERFDIVSIPETSSKTPDFKISLDSDDPFEVFAELKTLSFVDGNLNYIDSQKQGLDAQIALEEQISGGAKIGFSTSEIKPLHKSGEKYDMYSTKYVIEKLIDKIVQNIKKEQYGMGETLLLVDLRQICLPSKLNESIAALFVQKPIESIVSGVLWNVAFGKLGHQMFKPIEFEGRSNVDGELERNGILVDYPYIKGLVFIGYKNFKERFYAGLVRANESGNVVASIYHLCAFIMIIITH